MYVFELQKASLNTYIWKGQNLFLNTYQET